MRLFLILVPLVSSDICQDFCTQQLGSGDCSRGSYCKNNFDCHGLFWTSAEQSAICVYTGRDGSCPNRFPVLCREAASRLSAPSADMTQSPVSTTIPTVTANFVSTTVSQRSEVIPPVTSTTLPPTTSNPTTSSQRRVAPVTTTTPPPITTTPGILRRIFNSLRRNVVRPTPIATNFVDPNVRIYFSPAVIPPSRRARDNVTAVKLYFHYTRCSRSHPYVKLSFLNEGRNLGYYAIFDTGAHRSYTFIETHGNPFDRSHTFWEPRDWILDEREPIIRAAQDGEAYRQNPSIVPRDPMMLGYGVDNAIRGFPSIGTIQENIRLFSGPSNFTFYEPRLFLVPPPGDRQRVLLGASRTSSFAAAAGAFAIIPSPYADTDIASNWQLLMGQNSTIYAQRYCRHDEEPIFEWFRAIAPHHFFAVEGLMWLQVPGSSSRQSIQRLEMIIDSGGTNQIWLTPVMMNAVVAEIESHGPRRIPSNGSYPRFENCTRSFIDAAEVSELRVMPGGPDSPYDESALSLRFPFRGSIDYHRSSQQCTLTWKIGTVGASPNRLLIGTKILSKLVTVFDHTNQRVGFCRRSQTPIQ